MRAFRGLLIWRGWWDVLGSKFERQGWTRWDLEGHHKKGYARRVSMLEHGDKDVRP